MNIFEICSNAIKDKLLYNDINVQKLCIEQNDNKIYMCISIKNYSVTGDHIQTFYFPFSDNKISQIIDSINSYYKKIDDFFYDIIINMNLNNYNYYTNDDNEGIYLKYKNYSIYYNPNNDNENEIINDENDYQHYFNNKDDLMSGFKKLIEQ